MITLTIIGVVAALTIPTLMTKYQKHQYVVGLKKAYSQLQNAIKMVPLTEGCPAGDYDCAGMFEGRDKVTNIDGQDFGGDPFKKQIYLLSKQFKVKDLYLNGSSQFWESYGSNNGLPSFVTADGMIIGSETSSTILVDVNGIKGPNKPGQDVFGFYMVHPNDYRYPNRQAGTILPLGPSIGYECKNGTWFGALSCTEQALRDSKIDY